VVNALVLDGALDVSDLAERDEVAAAAAHPQALQALEVRTPGASEAHHDGHVFFLIRGVQQAGGIACACQAQRLCHILVGDAVELGLLAVDQDAVLRLIVFHMPVDIDHAFSLLEDLANLARDLNLAPLRRAINLGDHGFKHRRAGRHFGDLDAGSGMLGHAGHLLADALGDLVTLESALRLSDEVHLDVGDIGPLP